jgi:hypothetical protein
LYLVTGLATRDEAFHAESTILGVDANLAVLAPAAAFVSATEGSAFIIVDHERRLVVAIGPNDNPNTLTVLKMDAPTAANPRMLAGYSIYSYTAFAGNTPMKSVDTGPCRICEDEYAFGIRTEDRISVGNKTGIAWQYLNIFRYQSSGISEILDDVTWGYSKYSEPDQRSCNTETEIVSEASRSGEFFDLVRKHVRSYLGDARMNSFVKDETSVDSCPVFYKLQFPNVHTWDPRSGKYTDPEIPLRMIEKGKIGSPYKRDP